MRNNLQFMKLWTRDFKHDGDLNTVGNVSFDSIVDGPTVYKTFRNLIINTGHVVTTSNRCKGLVICCLGDCIINGTLSMTARGANTPGELFAPNNIDKILLDNLNVVDFSIGISGGSANSVGINGACGGGGDGYYYNGVGAAGTTFSGGAGGGGGSRSSNAYGYGGNGAINGGAGGAGGTCTGSYAGYGGGGAGNPGGVGFPGESGTGGLLMLFVIGKLAISNTGSIVSKGSNGSPGRSAWDNVYYPGGGGGGSGGGSITIFHSHDYTNNGTISANGGIGGQSYYNNVINYVGRNGGAGSIRLQKI